MQRKNKLSFRTVAHYLSLTLVVCTALTSAFIHPFANRSAVEPDTAVAVSTGVRYLLPGGMPFGIKLETDGVVVIGFTKSSSESASPAELAGIMRGDVIKALDGRAISDAGELSALVEASGGKAISVTVMRGEKRLTKTLTARLDAEGCYRAGLKVRDATAGIGTVTAIDPVTMAFVGLGHGICDSDTGVLMPLKKGEVFDVSVTSIRKGAQGAPGEIKGYFSSSACGTLFSNTAYGICGRFHGKCFDHISPVPVAKRDEVTLGKATVICTLGDNTRREYEIELVKMTNPSGREKNFVIEVTDPALLAETGGIVQGMSGSPILQNGKIIGAVTHVTVGDPTRGYGILIENMLNAANNPMAKAA